MPERAGNVMKHCQRPKTLWKEMPRLPEIENVMERDATHCQRGETLCKEMPFIARGFEKREKVGKRWKTLEKREAMLEKRKYVESHAWGDLKCDRVVLSFSSSIKIVRVPVI